MRFCAKYSISKFPKGLFQYSPFFTNQRWFNMRDCCSRDRLLVNFSYSYHISTSLLIIKQKSSLKNMGQAQKFQEFTSFGFNKISLVSELLSYHVLILLYCVFIICTLLKNSHSQTLSSRKYIKVIN